jgi:AcrR family transcriptional regulator
LAELDAEAIAAAALQVSDEHGPAGLTMRAVAERLGVTPMALYHHVRDKAALVALMVNLAIRELELPAPTGDWREDMVTMAHWMRDATHAHPALMHLRREHRVWTPSILPMTERWAALWQQSGLGLEDAMLAAAVTSLAVIGSVESELIAPAMDRPTDGDLAMFPSARLMLTGRVDPEVAFELLVRSVIDGVHSRLSDRPRAAAVTKHEATPGDEPVAATTRRARAALNEGVCRPDTDTPGSRRASLGL